MKPNAYPRLILINKVALVLLRGNLISLARGYLNQLELTQENFINNPFNPSERLYKTGDLGRY